MPVPGHMVIVPSTRSTSVLFVPRRRGQELSATNLVQAGRDSGGMRPGSVVRTLSGSSNFELETALQIRPIRCCKPNNKTRPRPAKNLVALKVSLRYQALAYAALFCVTLRADGTGERACAYPVSQTPVLATVRAYVGCFTGCSVASPARVLRSAPGTTISRELRCTAALLVPSCRKPSDKHFANLIMRSLSRRWPGYAAIRDAQ
ncbi:hypothetical protein C8Q80DRAFT_1808 [Daedaleopsis nitida]|nr:hypothetical protein C8Q80DRAFT_1808 [Daedaleopsis nitida]